MNRAAEVPFKIALGALFLALILVRVRHKHDWEKSRKIRHRHRRREVLLLAMVSLGWCPLYLYLLTPWLDRFHLPFPAGLRWLGAAIFLAGDGLFYWSHQSLGRNWSPLVEIREGHTLITHGPYRWVRHPMYASVFVIGAGLSLLAANAIVLATWLPSFMLMYILRVRSEEELMIEQFGDQYREYMKRSGRLWPMSRRNP